MTMHSPSATHTGRATLTDRYVHAATRHLPEDQRGDVGEELRGSIADRVDSLQASTNLSGEQAEYAALEELGDPDRLAAGYTGKRMQLIGPELYPSYIRVLKAVLLTAVPVVTVVIAVIEAIEGGSAGSIFGKSVWMAINVTLQVAFWITLTFAVVERSSTPEQMEESLGVEWTPDKLPDIPHGSRGSLGEMIASLVWLAIMGAAIVWQQFRSPVQRDDGEHLPLLDPDLWAFWLPLILVLLAAEMAFEVVKYRTGTWSRGLATANVILGAVFAAPIVYLAAANKLLNPAAVAEIQNGWPGFDPGTANTVIVVVALLIWAWDSIDGGRKALAAHPERQAGA